MAWCGFATLATIVYVGAVKFMAPGPLPADLVAVCLILDLCIWVPGAYYVLLVRRQLASAAGVRFWFITGLSCSCYLAPEQSFLLIFQPYYVTVALCIAAILVSIQLFRIILAWRSTSNLKGEQRICQIVERLRFNPKLASVIRSEWLGLYYGIFGWRLNTTTDNCNSFSYHHKNGTSTLLICLAVFQIPSAAFTHIIFHHIAPTLALLLTFLHIYTLFFTLSQAIAMRHRPIMLNLDSVTVRCGLMFEFELPYGDIAAISRYRLTDTTSDVSERIQASLFGNANVRLQLKHRCPIPFIFGIEKMATEVCFEVDNYDQFQRQLQARCLR